MLDAIDGIARITTGLGAGVDEPDWLTSRALERGFEIISEASRHIPEAMIASEPEIPWRQIAGLGNVLRHDYSGVKVTLLLVSANRDLPPLEAALRRILARMEKDE